jgi:hypothetical protein
MSDRASLRPLRWLPPQRQNAALTRPSHCIISIERVAHVRSQIMPPRHGMMTNKL